MKLDNIDYFSAEKLQKIIAERFGQEIALAEMADDTLDLFKDSVKHSIKQFESAMAFNSNSQNPKYLENKLLLDAIAKEADSRIKTAMDEDAKIKAIRGQKVDIEDPDKPGQITTVDTATTDIKRSVDDPNELEIVHKGKDMIQKGFNRGDASGDSKGVKVGDKVKMGEKEGDLSDTVAPEFKKLVLDMQSGMSKDELEKKYPNRTQEIEQLAKDLATVVENIRLAVTGSLSESNYSLGGREQAALRLLVGNQNFSLAKRALEMAKAGQSVPASLMKGFMPVIQQLDTFIRGGQSAVTRFKNLTKIVGRNETVEYANQLQSLLENEMETSEILLASQDVVDQITDMYEKIAELKSSAVLELVDRMANEVGQEKAQEYSNVINPALEALENALQTAREGAQSSVAIVKGEAPQAMVPDADADIETDADMDVDIEGDADIEDDFATSEPAAGGDEPLGRAER